ncbi:hypothetical protein OAE56_01090 [Verrucomicrobiales bacterium]|nr:hypothetical protein [Verrucomicrobiales bacterium]
MNSSSGHARIRLRHGTLWNAMERYGTLWNAMERYGTPWNAMERHGTPWNAIDLMNQTLVKNQTVAGHFGVR